MADHIAKEIIELNANPQDITEHADCILLAIDWSWRSGLSDEAIATWIQMSWISLPSSDTPAAAAVRTSFQLAHSAPMLPLGDLISAAMAKLDVNRRRTWPDWRTMPADKAIEHDRGIATGVLE